MIENILKQNIAEIILQLKIQDKINKKGIKENDYVVFAKLLDDTENVISDILNNNMFINTNDAHSNKVIIMIANLFSCTINSLCTIPPSENKCRYNLDNLKSSVLLPNGKRIYNEFFRN